MLEQPENMILTAPIIQVRAGGWQLCRAWGVGPGGHHITLDEGHQVVLGGTSLGLGQDRMCPKGLEPSSDQHATCYVLRDWWAVLHQQPWPTALPGL